MPPASYIQKKFVFKTVFFFFALSGTFSSLAAQTTTGTQGESVTDESVATIQTSVAPFSFFTESRLSSLISRPLSDADKETKGIRVRVTTSPTHALIDLGKFSNYTSPLTIEEISDGEYLLSVSADDYRPFTYTLKIQAGYQYLLDITLAPRDGYLAVKGDQPVQVLEVDGDTESTDFPIKLRQGYHSVRARSFGFKDFEGRVLIAEGFLNFVEISFAEAPFEVTNHQRSRSVFRPDNPGQLGSTSVQFEVSAKGKAHLSIYDSNGILVHQDDIENFTTWQQNFVWKGRNQDGLSLPEGTYSYSVDIIGEKSQESVQLTGEFSIDNSSIIAYRTAHSGVSGFSLVSDSLTLPADSFQLGAEFATMFRDDTGLDPTFSFGVNARGGVIKNLELLGIVNGAVNAAAGTNELQIGGAIKYVLVHRDADPVDFGLAIATGGSALVSGSDGSFALPAALPGVFLSAVADIVLSPFSIEIEPAFQVGPWNQDGGQVDSANGWAPRFQLSGGLSFATDWFTLGLSARTWFPDPLPVRTAISLQWLAPEGLSVGLWSQILIGGDRFSPLFGLDFGFIR